MLDGGVKHLALGEYANIGKEKVVQIDDHFFYHVYVNNPGKQSQNGQVKKKKSCGQRCLFFIFFNQQTL